MLYNQPYGKPPEVTWGDTPYINGNPSTGTMGSIPPAASIEYPQREIVNLINSSLLTPTNADLFQLAKAVQSGYVNWGLDVGAPNDIQITPVVPISSYQVGQHFIIKMGYGSTSAVTVNVSSLGKVALHHVDGTPLNAYELLVGQLIVVAYDGQYFQLIAGGAPGGIVTLRAPRDLYVDANIGSDTLYDGTSPVIAGVMGGPFLTIQKALATMQKYNLGGWTFTIHVADGVYANTAPVHFPPPNGSGAVVMVGNTTNPQAVSIFNTSQGSCWSIIGGGSWDIKGFTFRATAAVPGDAGNGIWAGGASTMSMETNCWNTVPGSHILMGPGGYTLNVGTHTIIGSAGWSHHSAFGSGVLYNNIPGSPTLTIASPVTFGTGFVNVADGGQVRPIWTAINGASNVAGSKYAASGNGVVQTGGAGVNYLPGNSAGTLSSGGQYL